MAEPDDLLPEQRGATPDRAEMGRRESLSRNRLGRAGRLRSWAAILVGLVVLALCLYLAGYVPILR
jgi:hypothetical protein